MSLARACSPILTAAAFFACTSADPTEIDVQMTLDAETCSIDEPGVIRLDCGGMVGVWLRDEATGATLGQACANLPEGETLDKLTTEHLAGVDLATTSNDAVRVEVAVYGGWTDADGCLPPAELPAEGAPQIIMSGSSEPVTFADSDGRLDVALGCEPGNIATPAEIGACENVCIQNRGQCNSFDAFNACIDEETACLIPMCLNQACADNCNENDLDCLFDCVEPKCGAMCLANVFFPCLDAASTALCERQFDTCLFGCEGNTSCETECAMDAETCRMRPCQDAFDECSGDCHMHMKCASIDTGA